MVVLIVASALVLIGLVGLTAFGAAAIGRRYRPRGKLVPVTGGRLHVSDAGPRAEPCAAVPIVLLHGASGNLEDMRLALGERLSVRHRVVMIDRPGHGFSERPREPAVATPAGQAALVTEALAELGIPRAIVVGYSWSGALAAALALAAPHRVAGLVLLAPVTHPWPGGISWYYRVAATPVLGQLFAWTIALPIGMLMLEAGTHKAFAPQSRPDGYVEHAATPLLLRPAEFLANARDVAALKASVAAQAPLYPTIAAPTVIITGDRDGTVSPRLHAEAIAAAIPRARLVVAPGVGHMVHHVASDLVCAEIERMAVASAPGGQAAAGAGGGAFADRAATGG